MLTITITVDGHDVHSVDVSAPQPAPATNAAPKRHAAKWLAALEFTLTDRQIDVLRLAATGMQYKQIAIELGISERTVRTHMNDIFSRTGVQSNTMAVSYAWLMGLISEEDVIRVWREIAPGLVQLA